MGGCIDGTKLMLIFQTGQNKTTFFFFQLLKMQERGKDVNSKYTNLMNCKGVVPNKNLRV